jgi:hypothetical protein
LLDGAECEAVAIKGAAFFNRCGYVIESGPAVRIGNVALFASAPADWWLGVSYFTGSGIAVLRARAPSTEA